MILCDIFPNVAETRMELEDDQSSPEVSSEMDVEDSLGCRRYSGVLLVLLEPLLIILGYYKHLWFCK